MSARKRIVRKKKYSDRDKAEYYKSLALSNDTRMIRRFPAYTGRGAYKKRTRRTFREKVGNTAVRDVIQPIASAIGGPLAGYAVGGLGYLADKAIKFFTGRGDYTIKENSLMSEGSDMPPIINRDPGGGFLIRRGEYIGDVISGAANSFTLNNYFVNPGQISTFPWLAQVAVNFEEWVCEGMYFEFRTMSADALNSTNTALGQVIMAASYNSSNANFTNKQVMENYEGGISCKPSCSMRYFVECARSKTVLDDLYVRPGAVPAGDDQRFYDLANFQIATNGLQGANVNVGELWVEYQISLRKPKMFSALGFNILMHDNGRTGCANNIPFGTTSSLNTNLNNIPIVFTGTTMVFPPSSIPQAFYGTWKWTSSAVTTTVPALTFGPGATSFNLIQAPNNGTLAVTQEAAAYTFYFPGNSSAADRTITAATNGTISVDGCRITIIQCSNAFDGFPE
nr:putative capsid protein [Crucivirus sp.]